MSALTKSPAPLLLLHRCDSPRLAAALTRRPCQRLGLVPKSVCDPPSPASASASAVAVAATLVLQARLRGHHERGQPLPRFHAVANVSNCRVLSSLHDVTRNLNLRTEAYGRRIPRRIVIFPYRYLVRCLNSARMTPATTIAMASAAVHEDNDGSSPNDCCAQIPDRDGFRVCEEDSSALLPNSEACSPFASMLHPPFASVSNRSSKDATGEHASVAEAVPASNGKVNTYGEGLESEVKGESAAASQGIFMESLPDSFRRGAPPSRPGEGDLVMDGRSSPRLPEDGSRDRDRDGAGAQNRAHDRVEGSEECSKRLRTAEIVVTDQVVVERDDETDSHISAAWAHWRKLGAPKFHVAPMVDQSELPFRMLCRKYGATAAYTPMLHSRLFAKEAKYRSNEFSTCPEDRPLFVQFCANDPDTLLEAARLVEQHCDYVDLNLGCPQRIAKKGYYGAFLMDNLPLIKSLVTKLATNLTVPVSCKIRVFPDLEDTLSYARMLEEAGCSLLAVHGRTRDQKNGKLIRADWDAIKAVKRVLRIPVLANGNIRWLEDVHACIEYTGVDGVMSAESLLENPALYGGYRTTRTLKAEDVESGEKASVDVIEEQQKRINELALLAEYLDLCEEYPVPMRMVRGHVHKLLGGFWFKCNPDIREDLNKQHKLTIEWLRGMVSRLMARDPSTATATATANGSLLGDTVCTRFSLQEGTGVTTSRPELVSFPSPSQDAIISVG